MLKVAVPHLVLHYCTQLVFHNMKPCMSVRNLCSNMHVNSVVVQGAKIGIHCQSRVGPHQVLREQTSQGHDGFLGHIKIACWVHEKLVCSLLTHVTSSKKLRKFYDRLRRKYEGSS
jgi:hypothetical protein